MNYFKWGLRTIPQAKKKLFSGNTPDFVGTPTGFLEKMQKKLEYVGIVKLDLVNRDIFRS